MQGSGHVSPATGVFVRLAISPSSGSGATLLDYVSPLGVAAAADPGLPVPGGTVAGMTADAAGHLFVLLHMLEHQGDDIPRAAKDIAVARWEDFRRRMDDPVRKPPRAAQRMVWSRCAVGSRP